MEEDFLAELETLFAQGSAEALPELNILGGFYGGTDDTDMGPGGIPYAPGQAPTVYYEGSDVEVLRSMNTEQLAAFQDTLVANGLVREVVPGRLDDATLKGMSTLMALGNRQGVDWKDVLDGIVRAGGLSGSSSSAEEFEPRPYLQPDYATLSQKVKQTFRESLGRDPDTYEMQQLAGELTGFFELEHEAATEFEEIQHEQQVAPGVQGGGTVGQVDPMSRFQELFESKYKHELDFVEDKAAAQTSRQVVEAGASTLSQMSRRT